MVQYYAIVALLGVCVGGGGGGKDGGMAAGYGEERARGETGLQLA